MDPSQFFGASRLLITAGKGGVGKTTVTAVTARAAADAGLRVLVVDVDGRPGLAALLCDEPPPLGYEPVNLTTTAAGVERGSIDGCSLSAARALAEYLAEHGLRRIAHRLASSGILDLVSTAAPGIDDLLVLGKIKQLERSHAYDLIVVDGPAAGHAITFLLAASGLGDAARVGPIQTQAAEILSLLADPARCQVQLATLAETTPVNEAVETAFALEDRVGVALSPIVVNAVDSGPVLAVRHGRRSAADRACADAAAFRNARRALHRRELERLADELPVGQIRLPWLPVAGISRHDVAVLAEAYTAAIVELA